MYPIYHISIYNPNFNTIWGFTNGGISRVNGGVESREQWGGVSMVRI
jgi:hypothetical protein